MWIEELGNGKYKYFERYTDPLTEKQKRVSITLTSKSNQAKKQATLLLQEKIDEKLATINQTDITLDQLYHKWIKVYKHTVKEQSYLAAMSIYKNNKERFNMNILARNVKVAHVQSFLEKLYFEKDYSYSYIDSVRTLFSNILEYARKNGYVDINIMREIRITKKKSEFEKERHSVKYLEPDELKLILEELNKLKRTPGSHRYAEAMEFISLTGLRYGELAALKYEDFDGESITISKTLFYHIGSLKDGKTTTPKNLSSYRTVDLSDRAKEIINGWIKQNEFNKTLNSEYKEMGFILTSSKGVPLHVGNINYALRKIAKKLRDQQKLDKDLSTHIFRHTHISQLASLGVPQKAIMDRVGHANPQTTLKIYTHTTKQTKNDLIKKLNDIEKRE